MMIMNNSMTLVSFFMVFSGLWSFVAYRKHLLSTFLMLVYFMLGIFFFMYNSIAGIGSDIYFLCFLWTLAACEGPSFVSLLVSIVRSHGNDYFYSFSVLGC
uniref:NADH-ubiquinone oxidoreductase chain 4L n=1 Tax=Cryptolithodes sitchensis TaxID=174327 RepID=L0E8Y2_CRYSI|nr:NADH dehydrogenase subunit 4L [Cryptolithodes sitchensis]